MRITLFWLSWMNTFQALVGCHDILILGKNPIKWRQRPDMTLAVDWDVKHQFKQINKQVTKEMVCTLQLPTVNTIRLKILRTCSPRACSRVQSVTVIE